MRKYLLSYPAILAAALVLGQPVHAQEKEKEKDKQEKKTYNEEIVIKRKTDKDEKVTIEIKGDEITVNGKPIEEFDDDNIVVRKRKSQSATIYSPFRNQGGTFFDFEVSNTAFLGVLTNKHEKGAEIQEVTRGSAAEKAGLKKGDVITRVDEDQIDNPNDLTEAIRDHKPEDKVTIAYLRNGKAEKTTAVLGKRKPGVFEYKGPNFDMKGFRFEMPDHFGGGQAWPFPSKGRLGIKAQDTEDGKGVKVIDVDDESAAEKAGIKEDDIITEFDGKKVNNTEELADYAREARDKPSVKITFKRDGKTQTVEVKTPRKLRTATL
jgi:Trypsin-like serine proteases, typically periplasmic, contain C-terminal PDZ domain